MEITYKNKTLLICTCGILVICVLVIGNIIKIQRPNQVAFRVWEIIKEEDTSQINFLKEVLDKETGDFELQMAQVDIIKFLGKQQDVSSIDLIIEFYNKTNNLLNKKMCILALSEIGTIKTVNFLIAETSNTSSIHEQGFIFERLYEIYFRANTSTKKAIKVAFENKQDNQHLVFPEKCLILYLEGSEESYKNLENIVNGDNQFLKGDFASVLSLNRIKNRELIKDNQKLLNLLEKLYYQGNDYIKELVSGYL